MLKRLALTRFLGVTCAKRVSPRMRQSMRMSLLTEPLARTRQTEVLMRAAVTQLSVAKMSLETSMTRTLRMITLTRVPVTRSVVMMIAVSKKLLLTIQDLWSQLTGQILRHKQSVRPMSPPARASPHTFPRQHLKLINNRRRGPLKQSHSVATAPSTNPSPSSMKVLLRQMISPSRNESPNQTSLGRLEMKLKPILPYLHVRRPRQQWCRACQH